MLSLLSGPLCSIVLCILAGIALRYALWFGRNADEEATELRADESNRGRVESLEQQLTLEQQARDTLKSDYGQLCEEFDRYRQDATTRDSNSRTKLVQFDDLESTMDGLQDQLRESREKELQLEAQIELTEQSANDTACEVSQQLTTTSQELIQVEQQLKESHAETELSQQNRHELQEQVAELEEAAEQAKRNYDRLDADVAATSATQETQIASLLTNLAVANEANADFGARCTQLATELQTKSSRESELGKSVATLSADARFVEDLRHQLASQQAAFNQRTVEMQEVVTERDTISEQVADMALRLDRSTNDLDSCQHEVARLQQELATSQAELETTTEERTALASSFQSIQSTSSEQLDTTRELVAGMQAELTNSRSEAAQLRDENSAIIKEFTTVRSRTKDELASAYDRIESLEINLKQRIDEAHRDFAAQLKAKEQELHQHLRLQETNAAVQFGAVEAERTEFRERLEQERVSRDQAIADELALRTEALRTESGERLTEMTRQLATLNEQTLLLQTEKEEVLHGLHRERDLRANMETQYEEIAKQNQQFQSSHETATARIGQFERRMGALVEELEDAEKRLAVRDAAVGELRVENKELHAHLEREKQERAILQRSLNIHAETLEKLRADSASLETLLERQARVQSSLQHHASMLRTDALDEQAELVQEYQDAGVSLEDNQSSESVGVYSLHSGAADAGITRIDPILGNVFATPPNKRDDLKLISGVGEALERKLNRLGIYHFEQVMHWDSHAINEFSNILAFKDRIGREGWVEQATELYNQYGMGRAA